MHPGYHNWMCLFDFHNKTVRVLADPEVDLNSVKDYLSKYGAKLSASDKVDYLILLNHKNVNGIKYQTLVEIKENILSFKGVSQRGSINIGKRDFLVFRRPHESGYKYIAPAKTPIHLYVPKSSSLKGLKGILVWLAHKNEHVFKKFMPATVSVIGPCSNPTEEKIRLAINDTFGYAGNFDYALIGDTKSDKKSKVVCIVCFDNKKYILKYQRWGKPTQILQEFKKLMLLSGFGALKQKVYYSKKLGSILIQYLEGNNLLDEFGITENIDLLKKAAREVGRLHSLKTKRGNGITHNDLGSVNFICTPTGDIAIIDWESVDMCGDQSKDRDKALDSLSALFHKVMKKSCCTDNCHKNIRQLLLEEYNAGRNA